MIPDDNELLPEESTGYRPGPLTVLITLLLVLAMLTTLLWPLFYTGWGRRPTPTPTPSFLLEARTLLPQTSMKSKEPFIVMKGSAGCKGSVILIFVGGGFCSNPRHNPTLSFMLLAPLRL